MICGVATTPSNLPTEQAEAADTPGAYSATGSSPVPPLPTETGGSKGERPPDSVTQHWSLRSLSVALLLATLIPLVVLIASWIIWASREEHVRADRDAREQATLIAAETGRMVASVKGMLAALAHAPALQAKQRSGAEHLFRKLLDGSPLLSNIGLVGRDGTILARAARPSSRGAVSVKDRDWFRAVIESGGPATGGFQLSRRSGEAVAVLAHPVRGADGEIVAVVTAALRLPAVSLEIAPAHGPAWVRWAVVDNQGLVLLHKEPWGKLGRPLDPFPLGAQGQAVVPNTSWLAVAAIPETMATALLREAVVQFGVPVLLLVGIAGGLAVWIARGTWRPARALAAAVQQVGAGAAAATIPAGGPREIAEVAASFRETLGRLDRRQRELSALLKASRALTASLELEQMLPAIVKEAAEIAGAPSVRLFMLDEGSQVLRCRVGIGVPIEAEQEMVVPVGISFSGQVAATRKPLSVADMRGDPRLLYPEQARAHGHVSYLGLPVQHRGTLLGVLVFNTPSPYTYADEEIAYLSAFADQVALAIQNAQVYSLARARAVQGSALFDVARSLLAARGVESIVQLILETARQRTRTDAAALAQPDPASGQLRISHALGVRETYAQEHSVHPGEGVSGRAFAERRPVWTHDILYDPAISLEEGTRRRLRSEGQRAVLAVPLLHDGKAQGTLMVASREAHEFQSDEVEALSALASLAAVSIENARLYGELQAELAQRQRVEADLRKIAHALEQSPNMVLITDRQGRIEYANPKLTQVTGYTLAELLGHNPRLLKSGATSPEEYRRLWQAITAGKEWRGELLNRRKDGTPFWVAVAISPLRDAGGTATHFVAVEEDITDRKREAEAQARWTRQLETIRGLTAEITHELDLDRQLALIQRRAAELVGAERGSLYLWDEGRQALVPRAWDGEAWIGEVTQRLGEGIMGTVAARREGMVVFDYASSPHAHPLFVERSRITAAMAEPLLYRDRLLGVIGVSNESAGRRFTEEDRQLLTLFAAHAAITIENARLHSAALRRGEELAALLRASRTVMADLNLQQILNRIVEEAAQISSCPRVTVLLVDRQAGVLHVGAVHGLQLTGDATLGLEGSLSGLVANTGRLVVSEDAPNDPRNLMAERDRAAGIVSYLGLPVTVREETLGVLVFNTLEPRGYSAEELAYLTSFADQAAIAIEHARLFAELSLSYQDLRQAQDELVRSEKLRALGQMAAGIAHDLNNALAAILGQVQLLGMGAVDPVVQEGLARLETVAMDGAQIVRRLQGFARQQPLEPLEPCDLAPIVQEAVELTRPRWRDEPQRRGTIIEVDAELSPLPSVLGQPAEIREALTNLVLNAVDAMPGGGQLRIRGRSDGGWVVLDVTDTGTGMSEEVRKRIFDPFFTTKGKLGSGLGLSVVYGIMERHGGRIEVTSDPGRGATFSLRFRVAPALRTAPTTRQGLPLPPRRLLLVDDDPTVRRTLANLLRSAGHEVIEADGGSEGLARLADSSVDLILTDLGMPGVSGWDVARASRERHPSLPVVLLTGWGDQPGMEESRERRLVDRVLGKPIRLEDLQAVIADLTSPGPDAAP
jgi:PAS domain S-box-containing protein